MIRDKRWALFPIWLKLISVIYSIIGLLLITALLLSVFNYEIPLAIYGFHANSQFSYLGTGLLMVFALKALVGVTLIIGGNRALSYAIWDTAIGIILCIISGFIAPLLRDSDSIDFVFQIELLVLSPLLFLLLKLRKSWHGPFTR